MIGDVMEFQNLCMRCMTEKQHAADVCPHCGRKPSEYVVQPHVLPPFTILNGKYLVGEELGAGGFGITYIALDMILERTVAIKEFYLRGSMYRNSQASSVVSTVNNDEYHEQMIGATRAKFEAEAKTLAKLENFPGIVNVYEYFMENGTAYIALEYLDGMTLKAYVKKSSTGRIGFDEVMQKLSPVMDSLSILHTRGILHRDISPDNIMVLTNGGVKLFDFGGVKQSGSSDEQRSVLVMKKIGYTPIEQYSNTGLGPWTDEYALAATMYYCITGKSPVESVERVGEDRLMKPSTMGADIARDQEEKLLKAMSIKADDRYPTIQAFKEDLLKTDRAPKRTETPPKTAQSGKADEKRSGSGSGSGSSGSSGAGQKTGNTGGSSGWTGSQSAGTGQPGSQSTGTRQPGSPPRTGKPAPDSSRTYDKSAFSYTAPPPKKKGGKILLIVLAAAVMAVLGGVLSSMNRQDPGKPSSGSGSSVNVNRESTDAAAPASAPTPTPVTVVDRDLSSYDTSIQYTDVEVIRFVQMILADWEAEGLKVDGAAGTKTTETIKAYQKERGLEENGVITQQLFVSMGADDYVDRDTGKLTYPGAEAAMADFGPSVARINDTKTIKTVQEKLKPLGYDCGKMDGDIGETTRKVLIRYERNNGLAMCGFVNQQLLESLGLESGTAAAGTAEEQSSNTPGEVYPNLPDKYVSWEEAKAAGVQDHVMNWKDAAIEEAIRKTIKKESGELHLSDVWEVRSVSSINGLYDTPIGDLSDFMELRNVSYVFLAGFEDHELDLSPLGALPLLRNLHLKTGLHADLSQLSSCAAVENLGLNIENAENLSALSSMKGLKSVTLTGPADAGKMADLEAVLGGGLRTLEIFSLQQVNAGEIDFKPLFDVLANMPNLTELALDNCSLTSVSELSGLSNIKNIKRLSVSGNKISDLSPISGMTGLVNLSISANEITDLTPLGQLTALKNLYFWHNHVSDISALKNLTALEYLDLSRNNISDISVLRDLKNLRRVTVTDNPIRDYSPVSHVENVSK